MLYTIMVTYVKPNVLDWGQYQAQFDIFEKESAIGYAERAAKCDNVINVIAINAMTGEIIWEK